MATRLKPSRINVDNTPRVGDGAAYQNDNDFHWSEGGGDMSYEDFEWVTLTGNSLVIENISNNVTPTGNFTVSAGTLRPGIEYVLRVNTGNTPYTMTLGTGVTNPNGYSTELTPNRVNQFKFIATSDSQLELEGVDTSEYLTGLTILSYGTSTWNDFITAYQKNSIVYCRASSNSNPATGAQNRLAFMAYVNDASNPTEVEFQYYRSRSSHGSDANQQDEVYVYKLTSAGTWTVTVRDTASKIATGTGLTKAYTTSGSTSTLTIANDGVLTVNGAKGTVIVNDIKQSATAPDNPTAGTAWYDTTNGALKVYNGSAWDTIATGGAISDTAYGPGWDGQTTTAPSQNAVYDKISSIDALIPSEATSSNKLADKAFVGDSINSVTAYYITKNANGDQFATYAELAAATTFYSGGVVRVPTKNDYTIVLDDENHDHATTRYIYNNGWEYQYTINETPLTQAQLDALNSGITAGKVSTYDGYATAIASKANDSEVVKLSGNQTINGTKTFGTSPVVPSKTTDAGDNGTAIATEAQVYKKQDTLISGYTIKLVNNNSLLGSGNVFINDVKISATAPTTPIEGSIWYDTTNDQLKVYDGTNWNVTGKGYTAGSGINIDANNEISNTGVTSVNGNTGAVTVAETEIVYATQTEYDNLPSSKLTDGKHYVIYSESPTPPSPWQPGANTVAYYPFTDDINDYSGNGLNLTNNGSTYSFTTVGGKECMSLNPNSSDSSYFYSNSSDIIGKINFSTDSFTMAGQVYNMNKYSLGGQGSFFSFQQYWKGPGVDYGSYSGYMGAFEIPGGNWSTKTYTEFSVDLATDVWKSIVLTWDYSSKTLTFYKDGISLGYRVKSSVNNTTNDRFEVCKDAYTSGNGRVLHGAVRNFVVEKGIWDADRIALYCNL